MPRKKIIFYRSPAKNDKKLILLRELVYNPFLREKNLSKIYSGNKNKLHYHIRVLRNVGFDIRHIKIKSEGSIGGKHEKLYFLNFRGKKL